MGQSALLFVNGIDPGLVRQRASMFGSSSPSYPMMASMDAARAWLEGEGYHEYRRAALRTAELRKKFPSLGGGLSLDPARLTLRVKDGPSAARRLEEKGVYPEMEDGRHVVLICTAQDSDADFDRLEEVLNQLREELDWENDSPPLPPPHLPKGCMSLREALFSPSVSRPLEDCLGEVAACQIAPYPPGVPVVAPGEVISKKELAYLQQIGYNIKSETRIVASNGKPH